MEPLRALWTNRALIRQFSARSLEMRHRGSMLGAAWSILNPLMTLGVYVFVFGYVFGGAFGQGTEQRTGWDYGIGVFLGLAIYHLISEAIAAAPGIVVSQPNYVKKVVFPTEVLPAAAVGASFVHMLVTLGMVIIGSFFGSMPPSWQWLWLPVVILPVLGFALGMAWAISALGVFFRDLGQIVGVLVTILMFASAIFYPVEAIPPGAWTFLQFNPLIHVVDMARHVLLWHQPPAWDRLLLLYLAGAAALVVGHAIFARLKRTFADVV